MNCLNLSKLQYISYEQEVTEAAEQWVPILSSFEEIGWRYELRDLVLSISYQTPLPLFPPVQENLRRAF